MVSFSGSRDQSTFSFFFPFRESPSSPSSSSSSASSPWISSASSPSGSPFPFPNASVQQKHGHMRLLPAEHLPHPILLFDSNALDHSLPLFQQGNITAGTSSISEFGFKTLHSQSLNVEDHVEADAQQQKGKESSNVEHQALSKRRRRMLRFRVGNASLKRLLSGAFAGAISRTAVAPLETIRTHLMVGSGGHTVGDVFQHIMQHEGWQGLFRGNGINVIRVAPSKAIELFAYDTVKKALDKAPWVTSNMPLPTSSIAGATAGVCSTLCTYPLELLKTRLTIQRGVYENLLDACVKICREEGPRELYRGLTPSLIGVVPYAATNYFAYDFLRKLYKKITKCDQVGNLPTLLIGSAAGAFASASTFPLEVARKQMQVGAISGRPVYSNVLHVLSSILEQQGPAGLYRGLGASCIKLIPAAGISFMCYEACKRILIEEEI